MVLLSDKRTSPRMAMHRMIRFECTDLESERFPKGLAQGLGRDISSEGISFLTNCSLRPGAILKVHVSLKADWASIPVFSEVRWTSPVRGAFHVGLRFLA
jgi:hypothetical protein